MTTKLDLMSENPWKTLNSQVKYSNNWIEVTEHTVIDPSGADGIYGTVHFKNLAIGIIALDNENNIWLVGQYRYPLKTFSWEIPEGGGGLNTDPIESGKRELKEETGIIANKWTKILEMDLSNSATDEKAYVFLAQDLSFTESSPEPSEQLEIKKINLDEALELILNGEIRDSITVASLLKLKLMLD